MDIASKWAHEKTRAFHLLLFYSLLLRNYGNPTIHSSIHPATLAAIQPMMHLFIQALILLI
jgi:hypothetical protein